MYGKRGKKTQEEKRKCGAAGPKDVIDPGRRRSPVEKITIMSCDSHDSGRETLKSQHCNWLLKPESD